MLHWAAVFLVIALIAIVAALLGAVLFYTTK